MGELVDMKPADLHVATTLSLPPFVALSILAEPESEQGLLEAPGSVQRAAVTSVVALAGVSAILFSLLGKNPSCYWVKTHLVTG